MSDSDAKLHLSIKDGVFEIAGSELFVSQQIENFKDIIIDGLKNQDPASMGQITSNTSEHNVININDKEEIIPLENPYPRVLHIEDQKVRIIKKIPGTTNSKKMVNTALAYIWGNRNIGIETVTLQEIRDVCQEQGCLDSPNFAKVLKGAKESIIIDGKKGSNSQICKLTIPGVDNAEELLESINGE